MYVNAEKVAEWRNIMKKKIVMLMGIVCMLATVTACGGGGGTTNEVATEAPQSATSGNSVTTDGESVTTAGESETTPEQPEVDVTTEEYVSEEPTEGVEAEGDGAVTEPPVYEDVKVDKSVGEITVTEVNENIRVPVVIRDIDIDRLRLLVRGYNEDAKKYVGEACFISSEAATITDMDGKKLEFSDLQPGNVIYVEIGGVLESDPAQTYTETIIVIQK